MGANVVRVHLQFGKFMLSPNKLNPASLARLARLLRLAEQTGLYLDLTGLACYRPSDVPTWYERLSESEPWQAQGRFWEGIAAQCADSEAVFCYDLINEPVIATEKRKERDWYAGQFAEYYFLQFLNLDPAGRTLEGVALAWMGEMEHDHQHCITAGLLPFNPGSNVLERLDFVSVHVYPETGKIEQALETLRGFAIGKPVLIEETFPLSCSAVDLKQFLLDSRSCACGWVGHYNGEPIGNLTGSSNREKSLSNKRSGWPGCNCSSSSAPAWPRVAAKRERESHLASSAFQHASNFGFLFHHWHRINDDDIIGFSDNYILIVEIVYFHANESVDIIVLTGRISLANGIETETLHQIVCF